MPPNMYSIAENTILDLVETKKEEAYFLLVLYFLFYYPQMDLIL